MSIYLISTHNKTALAVGNNGSGFSLVFPDMNNIRKMAQSGFLLQRSPSRKITHHKGMPQCAALVGGNARVSIMSLGSIQMDRCFLDLLSTTGGIPAAPLTYPAFANPRFQKWAAVQLNSALGIGAIGIGGKLGELINGIREWMNRGSKTDSAFTATGSFTGDLLEVLKNPESYLIKAMETFARQNPLVNIVFEGRDIGMAIGVAIETSLKFENIVDGMQLTIEDFKKIEETYKIFPVGESGDIRKMTAAELGLEMYFSGLINDSKLLVAGTLKAVMLNVRFAAKNYITGKVTGLLGGFLAQKLFPGGTSLVNYPKTREEWIKDFGRAVIYEIQKKVEIVATAKTSA